MATSKNQRPALRKAYLFVVANWAVGTEDVAKHLKVEKPEAAKLLKRIERTGLIEGAHVNGEKAITWQSMYDVENDDREDGIENAKADFEYHFPKGQTATATKRSGATGPRYTEKQLKDGAKLRKQGLAWKEIAAKVGVKSPGYFSKTVQSR